jgi:hypothetical protein
MATGDTPPRIPSRDPWTKRGEEGSLTLKGDGKILARQRQPGSNIAKERGRQPDHDAQEIRPSTGLRYIGTSKNNAWLHTRCAALNLRTLLKAGLTRRDGAWGPG